MKNKTARQTVSTVIWWLVWYQETLYIQVSTITIKSPDVITYVYHNFGVHDVRGQIPKSIYQASYFLSRDFPDNWS